MERNDLICIKTFSFGCHMETEWDSGCRLRTREGRSSRGQGSQGCARSYKHGT